jgi:hypothetical protein
MIPRSSANQHNSQRVEVFHYLNISPTVLSIIHLFLFDFLESSHLKSDPPRNVGSLRDIYRSIILV